MSQPIPDDPDRSPEFSAWIEAFKAEARTKGISERTLDNAFRNVRLNTRVIELNENQPEFSRAIWDYMDGAVSSDRVSRGPLAAAPVSQALGARGAALRRARQHRHCDLGA